jgi:hypothetical protein
MREAQVRPHLPQPVGRGFGHAVQPVLCRPQFAKRLLDLPTAPAQQGDDRDQNDHHRGARRQVGWVVPDKALDQFDATDRQPDAERQRSQDSAEARRIRLSFGRSKLDRHDVHGGPF